jgi:FlaA1/EpsC-like NDP-sugar epimerase
VGLRPGEKLHEELLTEGEGLFKTQHEKIMVLHGTLDDCDGLHDHIDELLEVAETFDAINIKQKLQAIIPEYTPELRRFTDRTEKQLMPEMVP